MIKKETIKYICDICGEEMEQEAFFEFGGYIKTEYPQFGKKIKDEKHFCQDCWVTFEPIVSQAVLSVYLTINKAKRLSQTDKKFTLNSDIIQEIKEKKEL